MWTVELIREAGPLRAPTWRAMSQIRDPSGFATDLPREGKPSPNHPLQEEFHQQAARPSGNHPPGCCACCCLVTGLCCCWDTGRTCDPCPRISSRPFPYLRTQESASLLQSHGSRRRTLLALSFALGILTLAAPFSITLGSCAGRVLDARLLRPASCIVSCG